MRKTEQEAWFFDKVNSTSAGSSANDDTQNIQEQAHSLKNIRYASDTLWRKRLALWVIIVDSLWLGAILAILSLNTYLFKLSDTVLIMTLGTTTINVLGLAFIVLKGLFNKP